MRPQLLVYWLLLLSVLPVRAQQCGAQRPPFQGYSFIEPYLIGPRIPGARLFVDIEELEQYYRQQGDPQIKGNLEEWHERFCEIPDLRDIDSLIYQTTENELKQLSKSISEPSNALSYRMQDNSFARYLKRHGCTETVHYLLYAKTIEPFVTRRDPWEQPQTEYRKMDGWLEEGLRHFRRTKSHYIRLRYAYQIIRLAHYSQQHERVLELYDELLPKIDNDPSIIEDWIEGHRAGAMMALGERVKA